MIVLVRVRDQKLADWLLSNPIGDMPPHATAESPAIGIVGPGGVLRGWPTVPPQDIPPPGRRFQ